MISSNTRASRSASRYSSPAQPHGTNWNGSVDSKGTANQGSRAIMARWLEPTLQSKTSFEEAGLMRHGVLENMAPLGTMPKPKKPAGDGGTGVRKIILRQSGASLANATRDVKSSSNHPQPKASPVSPPPTSPVAAESAPTKSLPPKESEPVKDAEDQEYDPKGGARRRRSKRVSVPAKKLRQSAEEQGDSITLTKPPTPKVSPLKRRRSPIDPEEREFADKVIEAAVDEALKHYRYPTAWALRTLYDERCDDADFLAMMEDIFRQTADAETMDEFSRLVEEKKREGKKDNQGCYYFVPPSTNSRFTPHKPMPAPYAALLFGGEDHVEGDSLIVDEGRATKRARTSHTSAATPRKLGTSGADGAVVKVRTPRSSRSNKRARRDSGSSNSSLSSAMSLSSPDGSAASLSPSLRGAAGEAAGAQAHRHADAPKSQPITTRGKTVASSRQAVSNTSESNSPTHHHNHNHNPGRTRARHASTAADDAARMPGRIAASDLFPNLPAKPVKNSTPKEPPMPDEDDDPFWDRRHDARKVTNGYSAVDSSVRTGQEAQAATPSRTTRRTRQSLAAPVSTRATRSASKRPIADVERNASPAAFSWQGDGSPAIVSRPATPPALRPTKKQRTGLRVKSSPVKKKGGTAAGVPRLVSEAISTINSGLSKDPTADNDEYCSACGNAGDVVCCDGCPRSFHFECVDMVQSDNLPDEWYCNECLIRRFPSRVPVHKGIFAGALNNLEKSIPRAFSLPKKLQTRFEGVKAGADGDYEDIVVNKVAKKRNGYDELPDFFKQREDGQAVLCHACQKPATEIRAIIPCSLCPFHWHIDCLDPPLAVPPPLKTWRCPAHIDDVLTESHRLAPAHRFRRLKGSQIITPAFSRGLRNNGHVEIDWSEEAEETERSGWPDPSSFGRSYKLSSKGVVLDFIEQLRRRGAGYGLRRHETRRVPYPSPPAHSDPDTPLLGSDFERSIDEMQVSLNLIGLKRKRSDPIDTLTSALMSAADANVLKLIAKSNADNIAIGQLTQDDKQGLRALLAQMDAVRSRICEVLGEDKSAPQIAASLPDARTPISDIVGANEMPGKLEAIAPLTEPTPPSTVDHAEGSMDID